MRNRWRHPSILLACAILLTLPRGVHAQEELAGRPVRSLSFSGVSALPEDELRTVIVTEARSCKTVLYAPLCWVTNSSLFLHKPELDPEEVRRDALRLRVHYWRAGWRETRVEPRVEAVDDGVTVTFEIEEGPATVVDSVVIAHDSLLTTADIRSARLPSSGDPVDITALDSAAFHLRSLLRERGFADAMVLDTAIVERDHEATVRLTVVPGRIATVGDVTVDGNDGVSERTIERLVDLRPGQLYRTSDLLEAQRRLYRSELFRSARMEVEETPDSVKPLHIAVQEAPFQAVRFAIGMTTLEFLQGEARYTRYNWMGTARRLDLQAAAGNLFAPQLYGRGIFEGASPQGTGQDIDDAFLRPTWRISAEASQPWLFSRRHSIAVNVFAQRRIVPGIVVDGGYGGGATFTRRFSDRITGSVGYRYERVRVDAGDLYFCVNFAVCRRATIDALSGSHALSPVRLSLQADRSDDPLAPTRGWTAIVDAEHASAATASDFRYNRASGELTHYRRTGPGVLAFRVRGAWVHALAGTREAVDAPPGADEILHPRKRVYAGGAQSVRGYGENQLGPRVLAIDANTLINADSTDACTESTVATGACDPNVVGSDRFSPRPVGGSYAVEGSIEYRVPLGRTLTGALFVDAGAVGAARADLPSGIGSAVTPGFGVRYQSPIGPIRIDLGIRPRIAEDLAVVTQVPDAEGESTLVQLDTPFRYDPVGPGGGFFRSVLSRLQLHLSIGEAF